MSMLNGQEERLAAKSHGVRDGDEELDAFRVSTLGGFAKSRGIVALGVGDGNEEFDAPSAIFFLRGGLCQR